MMAPNKKLYITLLIVLGVIILVSLAIPVTSPFFAIVTGIGCGGAASVIVGWLIDAANCRQNKQKAEINRDALFHELNILFESSVQVFTHLCEQCGDPVDENSTLKWYEWIDRAFALSVNSPVILKPCCYAALSFFRDISEESKVLRLQGAQLLDSGLVQPEDMQALSSIHMNCALIEHEFNIHAVSQEFGRRCTLSVSLIKNILDTSPLLATINEKSIGVFLYQRLATEHGVRISAMQEQSDNKIDRSQESN